VAAGSPSHTGCFTRKELMMMWGDYGWGWGMGFGMIGMVLFWVLVILGIVILVKWIGGPSSGPNLPPAKTALDILKERYARGEIDKKEFEEKKRDLSS
jgi:putative membrane protein